ncbi:MAG: type II secretion system F family protein [Epsilonproteobacteria bacterium]|nr:type II secretion system F family protein [Campylobacterota bacterium]
MRYLELQNKSEFVYEALTLSGKKINGRYAGSFKDFQKYLKSQGLTLLSYKEKKVKLKKGQFKDDDFASIVEELYYLINSGVKVDDALKLLIKSASKESSYKFLSFVLEELKKGSQLSSAIKEASKEVGYKISPLYISILSSGEEIGNVAYSLNTLKEFIDFKLTTASEVKQALSYPLFLIGMSVLMVFFVFIVVVPKFTEMFSADEMDKIPYISQLVLKTGLFVNENLFLILGGLSLVVVGIFLYFKFSDINFTKFLYKIPYLKEMIIELELSRAFNSMGMMIKGGVEIDKALKQSISLFSIDELKSIFVEGLSELKKGRRLSEVFAATSIIPPNVVSMMSVGETSATMGEVSLSLSQRFLQNFKIKTKKVLSLLEPVIVVFMGLFIAIIVVSIMLAVISINDIAM